ncbi:MAG: hypothetical protein H0Z19_10390 [Archaeoglobus sp.]|uniref:hypothetical protein n=1 Tax=Archaeoglobus sp. TaxID=1872626 RepID=UPI001D224645|nr:hypothetical protein [Archaeoglobus sp.]MBO8180862.1 hypothetical protein [Archaeoglobus sp.]
MIAVAKELLVIKRDDDGLEMGVVKLYEIETNELEQIKDWLWEVFQEIQEELAQRYNYEESGDDMEDDWNEDYWDDIVPEWEVAPVEKERDARVS